MAQRSLYPSLSPLQRGEFSILLLVIRHGFRGEFFFSSIIWRRFGESFSDLEEWLAVFQPPSRVAYPARLSFVNRLKFKLDFIFYIHFIVFYTPLNLPFPGETLYN